MSQPRNPEFMGMLRDLAGKHGVDLDAAVSGPPVCMGGCGTTVGRVSETCPACDRKRLATEHTAALASAWATVPETMRWVSLIAARADKQLAQWVPDEAAVRAARTVCAELDKHPLVTFHGPPGKGKTTLACGLMREWLRRGGEPLATPEAQRMGRGARFLTAHGLIDDRVLTRLGERVHSLDVAHNATVLVLDEVGRGKDTHGIIFALLHERHRDGKPTIVTTPCRDRKELADASDGGLARRVFDDSFLIAVGDGS